MNYENTQERDQSGGGGDGAQEQGREEKHDEGGEVRGKKKGVGNKKTRTDWSQQVGKVFGRYTVLSSRLSGKLRLAVCRCECGTVKEINGGMLLNGSTKSCGCWRKERGRKALTIHGATNTATHDAWLSMIERCSRKNWSGYHRYGGRGIKVCDRWLNSFTAFRDDMGEVKEGLTLDRIDNSGNYEPGNCRWATHKQQSRNTRATVMVEHQGKTVPVIDLADQSGLHVATLKGRLRRGWSLQDAMTRPVELHKRKEVVA